MKSWRFTQAEPPRTVLGWLRGAQPSPDPQKGPALRSLRLLRKPRRAWGGNINQSSEQCPIVGSAAAPRRSPARAGPARAGWAGAGSGLWGRCQPQPGSQRICGLSPLCPPRDPPALAAALAAGTAGSHPPGSGLGCSPAFSSADPGRKGEPKAAAAPGAGPAGPALGPTAGRGCGHRPGLTAAPRSS